MPINRTNGEDGKFTLEFDNGDARAFDKIVNDWGFVDNAQALLRFAMATMLSSKDKTLSVTKEDGTVEKVAPGTGFLKK